MISNLSHFELEFPEKYSEKNRKLVCRWSQCRQFPAFLRYFCCKDKPKLLKTENNGLGFLISYLDIGTFSISRIFQAFEPFHR